MKLIKIILSFSFLLMYFTSHADHMAGGYFEYRAIGDGSIYEIDFVLLRDCAGVQPEAPILSRRSDCGSVCTELGAMMLVGTPQVVDYGCGNTCDIFNLGKPGYQLYRFRTTVILPTTCDSWVFSVVISARNEVDFLNSAGNYFNYCRINNTVVNSSATLAGSNIVVGCVGFSASALFNMNSTDGDQVVFDLVEPRGGYACGSTPLSYESGLNANKPFPSNQNFALNSSTGGFNFTPNLIGTSYFAVRAREYRNSVLIGEIVIDGMIFIDNCATGNAITFGDFAGSGTNVWTVDRVDQEFCETFLLTGENNAEVSNITVSGPSYMTYSIAPASNGKKLITVCVNIPTELMCSEINVPVTVIASAGGSDCLGSSNGVGKIGYYTIHKDKGMFCPKNLFFTNRSPQGTIMPTYSRAEEYIYVGDSMPPFAPALIAGPVISNDHVTMVAGINVIIPACHGNTSGCVQLSAGHTIYLKPNSCSSDCEETPLEVSVDKIFNCRHETLVATATGEAPFTYHWNVNGSVYTTNINFIDIHDIVSDVDGAQISYSVTVFDAVGQSGQDSGTAWGTKRFYEPIQNNKNWFDYDPGSIFGESGYYYAANLGVYTDMPAYITDSVNSTPPWYGATGMQLVVFDRFGHPIMVHKVELEGTNDWSMDNGEFYWNGKRGYYPSSDGNNPGGACYEGDITDIFQYKLFNRNCYQIGSLDHFETDCDEEATFTIFSCLDEDYEYVQTKSMSTGGNDNETQVVTGSSRIPDLSERISPNDYFSCFPTPMTSEVEIYSSDKVLENVRIIDQTGKTVLTFASIQSGQKISVKHLSTGIYVLVADTDLGERRVKLLKE